MSDHSRLPILNPMFRFQYEQAQGCHVLLFPEGMIKLNGSAGEIMQLIDGKSSLQQIIESLINKFPDAGDISGDVDDFIRTATEKKWIYYE